MKQINKTQACIVTMNLRNFKKIKSLAKSDPTDSLKKPTVSLRMEIFVSNSTQTYFLYLVVE